MVDFRLLFEAAPGCNLVLTPELTIAAVSDGYLDATMTTRDAIVGRRLFDVFPDDPADPGATGVARLRASLNRVLMEKRRHVMGVQRYPIRRPDSEGGAFEERFWSPVNSPVLGADGKVAYIIHHVEDVTELVRLQRQKLEQERAVHELSVRSARYVQLLDTAPDAIVIVGEDGRIQLVNIQTEQLFGYDRAELVGEKLDLLIPERFRKQHARHVSEYFAEPSARPMGSGLELYGRRKDGSELAIEVSLSPHRGEHGLSVSASIRDISERQRLLGAARLTAERLASAVDSTQDPFALFDSEDKLIVCNSVYRRLMNETLPGPLIGTSHERLLEALLDNIEFPDAAARAAWRAERLAHRRSEPTSSYEVRLRDGRKLRVTARRTGEGGVVETIWDLTDDERLAEELRHARASAEAASRAKTEFLSSMSHELRTPLNAILGFAQLLQRDSKEPLSQRHRARVDQILQGGEHLLRLIDDVLNLARIEAGRISITPEPVDVQHVLREVNETLAPLASRQGVELRLEIAARDWPLVWVDRTRFAQILLNFGSNAIKYNRPNGSVTFNVAAASAARLRIKVADTGLGIPLEKQPLIFQPFQRAGQETGPIEGTGIGLVITRRLAELMGGAVGFTSVPGQGSTFWVDVPVHAAAGGELPARSASSAVTAHQLGPMERGLILYVEDNAANIVFMRDLLGSFPNTDLLTAATAEQAIELARLRRPRVILMDINLPGMSGIDALRVLEDLPETVDIPVVALTAAATERDRQRGLEAGFYRYLTKPVDVEELEAVLEELLSGGCAAQRSPSAPVAR